MGRLHGKRCARAGDEDRNLNAGRHRLYPTPSLPSASVLIRRPHQARVLMGSKHAEDPLMGQVDLKLADVAGVRRKSRRILIEEVWTLLDGTKGMVVGRIAMILTWADVSVAGQGVRT